MTEMMTIDPTPEFRPLYQLLAFEPQSVRELFDYAVTVMMIGAHQARILEIRDLGGSVAWLVETVTGSRYTIAKPELTDAAEQALLEQVRQLIAFEPVVA